MNRKKKRLLFVASSFLAILLIIFLIIKSFQQEIVFFYAPKDLSQIENWQKLANKKLRVGGLVVKNSVRKIDALTIQFAVADDSGEIKIKYQGLTPDLFREGQGVIAIGRFNADFTIFEAQRLLVKHDEKYMPPELKKD